MRIKETYTGFTDKIVIGRFGFFIVLDEGGIELKNNDLVDQAMHFNTVVLLGDEPFKQRDEIAKFIKRLKTKNNKVEIIIYTNGLHRPIGISDIDNIVFIVNPLLKNSNIPFDKRINYKALNWFSEVGGLFAFNILEVDDIDEAKLLVNNLELEKRKVYLVCLYNKLKDFIRLAKATGLNLSIDLEETFKKESEEEVI